MKTEKETNLNRETRLKKREEIEKTKVNMLKQRDIDTRLSTVQFVDVKLKSKKSKICRCVVV